MQRLYSRTVKPASRSCSELFAASRLEGTRDAAPIPRVFRVCDRIRNAVVAIDVAIHDGDGPIVFAGTAQKFLPHVTLLPRTPLLPGWSVGQFGRRFAKLSSALIQPIELIGPIEISPDLVWYECTPRSAGFCDLLNLHHRALCALPSAEACVFRQFTRENFRPHLTVSWNGFGRIGNPPELLRATPRAISLYSYCSDPKVAPVRRTEIARFGYVNG